MYLALWKKGRGREPGQCTRNPPCDLWDENMLLDEMERQRQARAGGNANRPQVAQPQRVVQPQPVVQPQQEVQHPIEGGWQPRGWLRQAEPAAPAMVPGVFGGVQPQYRTPTPPPGYRAGSLAWMTEDPRTLLSLLFFFMAH